MDGDHTGVLAWAVQRQRPTFFCTTSSDIWHHYVSMNDADVPRYRYAGLCADIDHGGDGPHEQCGHDELDGAADGSVTVMGPEQS